MKRHISCMLTIAVLAVNSRIGWGGIIRHDREEQTYRELGAGRQFRCVGEVTRGPNPSGRWRPSGSAVLVAPQWALTAGHVAASEPFEAQRYHFAGEEYRAIRRELHPNADFKNSANRLALAAQGADLALVQLDRPVKHVSPAVRCRGKDEVGRTIAKIGYGCIGDGVAGMTRVKGRPMQERRGGNNVCDAAGGNVNKLTLCEGVLICDFDDPRDPTSNQTGDAKPVELEIGQSVGDSGGGWFIERAGSWELVAITSAVLPNKGEIRNTNIPKYGLIMAGMRLSSANDWIDQVIETQSSD